MFIIWFGGPQQSRCPPLTPSQQIEQWTPKRLLNLVTEVREAGFLGIACFALLQKYLCSKYRFDPRTGLRGVRSNLLRLVKILVVKLYLAFCY